MTTANKITLTRIFLIPLFVLMAIYYGQSVKRGDPQDWQRWTAICIFVAAAASDGLDGYIARRFNQRSRLGVVLDPIADKGLLLAGIITLSFSNWDYALPVWFAVLVITRDVIVVLGTVVLHYLNGSVQVRPSWTGKCATALQMVALAAVMLQLNLFTATLPLGAKGYQFDFLDIPVCFAGMFTTISGFGYIVDGIAQLHDRGHAEPENAPESDRNP